MVIPVAVGCIQPGARYPPECVAQHFAAQSWCQLQRPVLLHLLHEQDLSPGGLGPTVQLCIPARFTPEQRASAAFFSPPPCASGDTAQEPR